MKNYHEYWSFAAVRGVLALLAAATVAAMPRAAADLFSIPILLGFAVGIFALYSMFDMAATILLAKVMPAEATGRRAYYPQAAFGFVVAILLFLTGYRVLSMSWLVWLAAAQAAVSAVAEYFVARSTHREYGCLSCYTTVFALTGSAILLPFAAGLGQAEMTLALAAYLALFGSSELALGGRMLFLGYRVEHPAVEWLDASWKASMESVAQLPVAAPAVGADLSGADVCNPTLTCDACPADPVCRDNSVAAQVSALLKNREPRIVNTIRAATLLQSHR